MANKKSLGYGVIFTANHIRPNTGKEWVYTATDEQMEILYKIEALFDSLVSDKFAYTFYEIHGTPEEEDFEGWEVCVRRRYSGDREYTRFRGFPVSAQQVLSAIQATYRRLNAKEENDD